MLKFKYDPSLPLHSLRIPKGGTNREGLTWEQWYAAACIARRPANMLEHSHYARYWEHGYDPTDMGTLATGYMYFE